MSPTSIAAYLVLFGSVGFCSCWYRCFLDGCCVPIAYDVQA